jgi:colanic acid/amylovoran biosynthesis protein
MTLVLCGVTGLRNRGVEALVRAAIDGFARHLPGQPTTVITTDPLYDGLALKGTASVVTDSPAYFQSRPIERYLRQMKAAIRPGQRALQAIDALKSATAVIASGGDVFSSDYNTLRRHVGHIEIAQAFGKPTIFLAHSIGPFRTKAEADMTRAVLARAALITVRESWTRQYVMDELRIPGERVQLTADVAFLLAPSDADRIAGLKRYLGIGASGYVALAPSEGITTFSSATDHLAHDQAWIRTIEHILSSSADDILIVPHVQDVRPSNDDRRIASRLVEAVGYHPRVRVAWGELSAGDFKGLIRDSRYLVGERMHACIAALSTAVPTIALGYSVKARGIMEDLLGRDISTEGLHLSVAQFVDSDGLRKEIGIATADNAAIRRRLERAAIEAKRLAEANFIAVKDALVGRVKTAA